MNSTIRRWANVIAAAATIIMNIVAVTLPLNGLDTGEISDRFDVLFVPAGYVFSIWSLIYIGFIAFAIYQALPSQRDNKRLARIGYWFVISSIANIVWLFLWHYEYFVLTLVAMLTLLVSLIIIYTRLNIGREKIPAIEKWSVDTLFSVYLGWISVATIANISTVLFYIGWNGWGISPVTWAIIMLVVATALGAAMSVLRRDTAYMLVLVWAFIGIAIKQADTAPVAMTAWAAAATLAIMIVAQEILRLRGRTVVS